MRSQSPILLSYQRELEARAEEGRLRRCRLIEPLPESADSVMRVRVDEHVAINFSSNDYLGLSRDERLKEAVIDAVRHYGTGSAASRLVSGTQPLVKALEAEIATFKRAEAALVFNSGYQANVGILQAILQPGDWVFCDKLNHASLVDGCLLSGARWTRYRHLDLNQLARKLEQAPPEARKWIVTDSVFSMDGDYPDLIALCDIAEQHDALILVDEAHATGLYGKDRRSGLCEQFGVSDRVALQMGTFSKALGGSGAYVAGPKILIDTLINRARGFIYSTAQSPAVVAAALQAVKLVQDDSSLTKRLWRNVALFEQEAINAGLGGRLPLPLQSPIVPLQIGDSEQTMRISDALLEAGYFVQGIRPPTVPPGTSRLRIALSAAHTEADIQGLTVALANCLHD